MTGPCPLSQHAAAVSPIVALRAALLKELLADTPIVTALGGPRIYDEAPRGTPTPYVVFGDVQMRDWSTMSDQGYEQIVRFDIWSQQRGLLESLHVAGLLVSRLETATLTPPGWTIVNLTFVGSETNRDNNGRFARTSVRFRITMEKS